MLYIYSHDASISIRQGEPVTYCILLRSTNLLSGFADQIKETGSGFMVRETGFGKYASLYSKYS